MFSDGGLAQLVEHLLCKQGVIGSNPIVSRFAWYDFHGIGFVGSADLVAPESVGWGIMLCVAVCSLVL